MITWDVLERSPLTRAVRRFLVGLIYLILQSIRLNYHTLTMHSNFKRLLELKNDGQNPCRSGRFACWPVSSQSNWKKHHNSFTCPMSLKVINSELDWGGKIRRNQGKEMKDVLQGFLELRNDSIKFHTACHHWTPDAFSLQSSLRLGIQISMK